MDELLTSPGEQWRWEPVLINGEKLMRRPRAIVCGMGGSALAASLYQSAEIEPEIWVHRDYGLPSLPTAALNASLIVLSSYSGNTEEVLDSAEAARREGLPLSVIASGGRLLAWAREHQTPHIILPADWPPRLATGYFIRALAKIFGRDLPPPAPEDQRGAGEALAGQLVGEKTTLIYASTRNGGLAYNWKVRFNETAKQPAFFHCLPEQNHNELASLGANRAPYFDFILLTDSDDDGRIQRRFQLLEKLLTGEGAAVRQVSLAGRSRWDKIANSVALSDWTTFHLAKLNGVDPEETQAIEEFKKL